MNNFRFKSENGTETNIEEVVADKHYTYTQYGYMGSSQVTASNDNGYPLQYLIGVEDNNNLMTVIRDGTSAGEGITTTNNSFRAQFGGIWGGVLQHSTNALAKYKFYPEIADTILAPAGTTQETMIRSYPNQPIPSWCKYIKVLLIGGGGGGGGGFWNAVLGTPQHAGTGGGCGELVVACIEREPGVNVYNLTLGKGGEPGVNFSIINSTNIGHPGTATTITVGYVSIVASGGNGGAALVQNTAAGIGGGQSTRGSDVASVYSNTTSASEPRGRNNYSGKEGAYWFSSFGGGSEVNGGGQGFARNAQNHYGFYAFADNRPSDSPGLVREMKRTGMYYPGYGIGGDGSAGSLASPTRGMNGCACVLFFPGKPKNYPLGDQA